MRKNLHYDWHWVWSTGNGDIGNQGIHEMDLCRWFGRLEGLPRRVLSFGGRFGYIDDGETPNTQIAYLEYDSVPVLFEVKGLRRQKGDNNSDHYKGVRVGIVVECEQGYFAGGRGGGWIHDNQGAKIQQFVGDGGGGHQANFIAAMRSRRTEELKADILEGHLSSAMCHLANISYRLGEPAARRQILERVGAQRVLRESFERFQDHLLLNHVDLQQTPRFLGPWLEVDSQSEQFTAAHAETANPMLRRVYREPFVVPEEV